MKLGCKKNSYYTQDGINGPEISIFEIWASVFFEIAPSDKHSKVVKSEGFEFLKKILILPKMGLTGHFGGRN